jgi:AbrB family looped-hinge helix DNA binding protein
MERRRRLVKVTRRGQTTIPLEIRRRHRIEEGTRLVVEDRGSEIVFRRLKDLEDAAGFLAGRTSVERLNRLLAKSREDRD